jgi:hypothetical protein
MYKIRDNLSPKIVKSFIVFFLLIAFINSLTFGVAEYRQMKKLIKKEFSNIALTINQPLSDAIWRGDRRDVNGIIDGMMNNYHITGIKILNYEDKSIAYEKYKSGRSNSFSKSATLLHEYNGRAIKVAKLRIYSDQTAVIYRSKKVFILLLLKTLLEAITVVFLIFWAFRRVFGDYLFSIKDVLGDDSKSIKIDLNSKNNLSILETTFRSIVNKFIKFEIEEKDKVEKEVEEAVEKQKKAEEEDKNSKNGGVQRDMIQIMNPPKTIFSEFFTDIFTLWQPKQAGDGDIYLFSEVSKSSELLFIVVDYSHLPLEHKTHIPLILKEIERDIFIKQVANGKIFSLGKILDYIDKKIRTRLSENGIKIGEEVEFSGLIMLYDKSNNTITYSSNGVLLFGIHNDLISVFDEFGQFGEGVKSKITGGYKEHTIDITEDDALIYLVSKGMFKQVGKDGKTTLGKNGFAQQLEKIFNEPFLSQEEDFRRNFESFRGEQPQTDNLTLVGMKFKFIT